MTLGFQLYFDKTKKVPTHFPEKIIASVCDALAFKTHSFYNRFPDYPILEYNQIVEGRAKLHTIREDGKNRWKAGMNIHFVVGNRTPKRFQFAPVVKCVSTQKIEIIPGYYLGETVVKVDGRKLSFSEIQQLAWNDGFTNFVEFAIYFNDGFKGKIIHWTNLKY